MLEHHSTPNQSNLPPEEAVQRVRELWTLSEWAAKGDAILHALSSFLIHGSPAAGFVQAQPAQKEALGAARDRLLPLMRSGLEIQEQLCGQAIEALPASARTLQLARLDALGAALLSQLNDVSRANQRIVEEWWRDIPRYGDAGNVLLGKLLPGAAATVWDWLESVQDQARRLAESLDLMRSADRDRVQLVDLIEAAQRLLPRFVVWKTDPRELSLEAACRRADLEFVLTKITKCLEQRIQAAALGGINEIFRRSREDELFAEEFEGLCSRYFDLLIKRPAIEAYQPAQDTLALSVAFAPENYADWRRVLPALEEDLSDARAVARANDLGLWLECRDAPPSLEIRLCAPLCLPGSRGGVRRGAAGPLITRPHTDTLEFPAMVSCGEEGSYLLSVKTQRTPFLQAEAFISFRDALAGVCDYAAVSRRRWQALGCQANCSLTLNEDSFREGFFDCRLEGPAVQRQYFCESTLADRLTFSWEKIPESELAFFNRWNRQGPPQVDRIVLPANAFADEHVRAMLARLEQRFRVVRLDLGARSDLAALYAPHERPQVIGLFLRKLVDRLAADVQGEAFTPNGALWCQAVQSGGVEECGDYALFRVEAFNEEGLPVRSGAFSPTSFELAFRPHSDALESMVLARFQSALNDLADGKDLRHALAAADLGIPQAQYERLAAIVEGRFQDDPQADPVAAMIALCRDPWNVIELAGDRLVIKDAGHPVKPDRRVRYGVMTSFGGKWPIHIFRRALALFDTQEQGKHNGYTFSPTASFIQRFERRERLPLEIEGEP